MSPITDAKTAIDHLIFMADRTVTPDDSLWNTIGRKAAKRFVDAYDSGTGMQEAARDVQRHYGIVLAQAVQLPGGVPAQTLRVFADLVKPDMSATGGEALHTGQALWVLSGE